MGNKKTQGLVLWTYGHQAQVFFDDSQCLIDIPGKWRLNRRGSRPLAPGDNVIIGTEQHGWRILERLTRFNEFTRRQPGKNRPIPQVMAVNLDLAIIVGSVCDPVTPFGMIDRLLITSALGGVKAILVLNKTDLVNESDLNRWKANYKNAVNEIAFVSALQKQGIDELKQLIVGKRILLAGSSGVGKSSILNVIDPKLDIKTRKVSGVTGKGRHTTSIAILHQMEMGGWLIDSPGLRECGPYAKTPENLAAAFPEMAPLLGKCKFRNCLHKSEIGCKIKEISNSEEFPPDRYKSYLKLLSEAVDEQTPIYLKKR